MILAGGEMAGKRGQMLVMKIAMRRRNPLIGSGNDWHKTS